MIEYCAGIIQTYTHDIVIIFPILQFYVAESSLELLARHMLFLALLYEPQDKMGVQGNSYGSRELAHTYMSLTQV